MLSCFDMDKMEVTELDTNEFIARGYQSEILEIAVKSNTIIYLPTGSGKTYIAIMLINRMSREIIKPNNKITVFLLCVSMMICVCLGIDRVNLIIFDECHQAVENQPMRQIMKLFENVSADKQPRVLGLTATLLNGNCAPLKVEEVVRSLETTFQSKVATVRELAQVMGYSTNPQERIIHFKKNTPDEVLQQATRMVSELVEFVSSIRFPKPPTNVQRTQLKPLQTSQAETKVLVKKLRALVLHMQMLGIFGALKSTLACIVTAERFRRHAEDSLTDKVLTAVTTTLAAVMALLEDTMVGYSNADRIFKFSSPQVLTLLEILREFRTKNKNNLCGIVFVQQRFTAQVLYYIIKALADNMEEFNYIRTEFMVGYNANSGDRDTRENQYSAKVNKRIVRQFYDGDINLLIASNVVEEGIDIPRCTLVVKFDRPMDYRSYIQSKGRARAGDSWYIIMVPAEDTKFKASYQNYKDVEEKLQQYLVGKTDEREAPTMQQIEDELYKDRDVEPYYTNGYDSAHVTASSAIQLVNRYCQSLHRDRYSALAPNWYLKRVDNKYAVVIEMPIVCPLRERIEGPLMATKVSAKRVAALEVCKRLHQIGELNKNLLPITESEDPENFDYLFTHWITEEDESETMENGEEPTLEQGDDKLKLVKPKPGTKKFIRQHKIHIPKYLVPAATSVPNVYYPHKINVTATKFPVHTINTPNLSAELVILSHGLGFALLTLNPLPSICEFPIFVSSGEISVQVSASHTPILLPEDHILALRKFNYFLLDGLLKIMKNFLAYDNTNEAGMMLLVPMMRDEHACDTLELNLAHKYTSINRVEEPSLQEKLDLVVSDKSHDRKIVWPWHRISEVPYFVSKICYNLHALSPFPGDGFPTYAAYFKEKYHVDVKNPNEPLLLVKGISKRLNCILPRAATLHGTKRKKQDMMDGFEEHLVPELCIVQDFPAPLWYKANLLPTILHRITCLLQAESLRADIVTATGIGKLDHRHYNQSQPVRIDERIMNTGEQKIQPVQQRNVTEVDACALTLPSSEHNHVKPLTNKDYSAKMLEKQYPWTDEQEPIDIERHLDVVTLMEIEFFERFVNTPVAYEDLEKNEVNFKPGISKFPALTLDAEYEARPILMLDEYENKYGPPQWVIFQCLMAAKATDVLNLERLETLGDSFLKLSVSLFLLMKYPQFSEGRLTYVKGKIIGNKNLLYCGLQKNLGGYMKVSEFSPRTEWLPPGMHVPQILQDKIATKEISVNKLFEFEIPKEEQISGVISEDTAQDIADMARHIAEEATDGPEGVSTMNRFLGHQHVSDKTVSDCVEALIGAYLHSNGTKGALAVMGWLGIIPESENPSELFAQSLPSPLIDKNITAEQIDYHIPNYRKLEEHLGYTFKNRAYLLQALTHASYSTNRLTDCYQRLEFLGDAVLDFLITCHIFEMSDTLTCMPGRIAEGLSPGQLTDLRSALVNNVTFAGLVVRNGFHAHLRYINTKLMDIIDTFVKFQEERDFVINEEVLILTEDEPYMAEHVNIPKALGDVFESLAGAVFLDTGMDLQATWSVFHKLMWREIEMFRRNVPKSPVRMLFESVKAAPKFG
ncbi:Dicer-2 [Carabus blaptoides fortunei]